MNREHKIRGYRNMLGLTQEKLGEELGISKQSYYNKETGKTQFSDKEKPNLDINLKALNIRSGSSIILSSALPTKFIILFSISF